MKLSIRGLDYDFSEPKLMGVINLTPDSFSGDGLIGQQGDAAQLALTRARAMIAAGAHMIDLGAVSTRPGFTVIDYATEVTRLMGAFKLIRQEIQCFVSIDTFNPSVAELFASAGADIINDVNELQDFHMARVVAKRGTGLVIMHGRREHQHRNIIDEIRAYWDARLAFAARSGVRRSQVILDPGLGFGKSLEQNLEILQRLSELCASYDRPVMIGASRKGFLGQITGHETAANRDVATAAVTALAVQAGAKIIRVHNVAANADALKVVQAVQGRLTHP